MLVLALALAACGEAEAPPAPPDASIATDALLSPEGWRVAEAAEDPFEDRPPDTACTIGGYGPEAGVFEVETDLCGYITAVQPLPVGLPAGAELSGLVWHLGLFAQTATRAHIALRIGPHTLMEARPAVPGPEAFYPVQWTAPVDLPIGTPAYFHVSNHGTNSYRLGPLAVR